WQHGEAEKWLARGNPWELVQHDTAYPVGFGGHVEAVRAADGSHRYRWRPAEVVEAVAHDTPVVGWRGRHVNTLRLWNARPGKLLRLDAFNRGDFTGALSERISAEALCKVLYPSTATEAGKELRLRQEFFFTSASLQDLLHRYLGSNCDLQDLPKHAAIQLNDTHPALAVAELMRLLLDDHGLDWGTAARITQQSISYTNHTLLPEALESWPVPLLERLLPRHMQLIYELNARFLGSLSRSHEPRMLASVSMIEEHGERHVRMGHLAFIGSHKVNGVSALHTDLMRSTVFRDLHAVFPGRIVNQTNGISFRRWLHQTNPRLSQLLVDAVGPRLLEDSEALRDAVRSADDRAFQEQFAAQRRESKVALAALVAGRLDIKIDPDALFDIQIKRIHEYKRQLLNILETIGLYQAIKANPAKDWTPRVKILAGKAAADYHQAKLIIKLAHDVACVINRDPEIRGLLRLVFIPNYNVSLAQAIIPAADLSEQISTAGMEASGTGNMKLALNGAITIGTLDGANVELRERVGAENIAIFGLTAEEVAIRRRGWHDPRETIGATPALAQVLQAIEAGVFSPDEPNRFWLLLEELTRNDHFMVTADFESYWATQRSIDEAWQNQAAWWRSSILNTAQVGWFSSDRTIRGYAGDIWNVVTQ
ncbi:MAG: glycogen/starch/alpha-glucan phosphorylase, partial [Acetobacteraceae bacterium]|nr:glycogen/starch/alpha-glucan phosphorylase [Acetobacteraceae bacterium]